MEALVAAYKPIAGQKSLLEAVELIPSAGGCYELKVDGKLVYSKLATGAHLSNEEAVRLVREAGQQ